MLFYFLFESSHSCSINIFEVKSFLYNQSILDARKSIFSPHSEFEMKDLLPLCNFRWQCTCLFFWVIADVEPKS